MVTTLVADTTTSIFEQGKDIYAEMLELVKTIQTKGEHLAMMMKDEISDIEQAIIKRKAELAIEAARSGSNEATRKALTDDALAKDSLYQHLLDRQRDLNHNIEMARLEITGLERRLDAHRHGLSLYKAMLYAVSSHPD